MARCRRKTLKIGTIQCQERLFLLQNPNPTWKFNTQKPKSPLNPANLKPHLFFRRKMATPNHLWGGGGRSYGRYGRLGFPFISVTRKVRENTKKLDESI